MAGKPVKKKAEKKFCPVCQQPLKWFGDHWVCVNIKVHDQAANARRGG
jgi:hypothetical protein